MYLYTFVYVDMYIDIHIYIYIYAQPPKNLPKQHVRWYLHEKTAVFKYSFHYIKTI